MDPEMDQRFGMVSAVMQAMRSQIQAAEISFFHGV